jgi:NinB protein.
MSRLFFILSNDTVRERAISLIRQSPDRSRVEIKDPLRSLDQNAKMWAMLTDISQQLELKGEKYPPEDWKTLILHEMGKETRFIPSLDGHGFVPLGVSSSKLSKQEMSDLIEYIYALGSQQNVIWSEPIYTERTA